MLYEAATWRDEEPDTDVLRNPHVAVCVEGWGREGDTGVVVEDERGHLIGPAWFRFFDAQNHGFGFAAPDIPELTVAVRRETRDEALGAPCLTR
jgi:hypothetical protein